MSRCRICDTIMSNLELAQDEYDVCFNCKDKANYLWDIDGLQEDDSMDDLDVDN